VHLSCDGSCVHGLSRPKQDKKFVIWRQHDN
jgi:hypothetical protein